MKIKELKLYRDIVLRIADQSYCKRLKVGALAVKDQRIISYGYNGTPPGFPNVCEHNNATLPEVLHAEENLIIKLAKAPETAEGSSIFLTHAPCEPCAKLLGGLGLEMVYYINEYRNEDGIRHLVNRKVPVRKLTEEYLEEKPWSKRLQHFQ